MLGGVLVFTVGWRWVFYANVPFGLLGFLLTLRYVPAPAASGGRSGLDIPAQVAGTLVARGDLVTGLQTHVVVGGAAFFAAAALAVLTARR